MWVKLLWVFSFLVGLGFFGVLVFLLLLFWIFCVCVVFLVVCLGVLFCGGFCLFLGFFGGGGDGFLFLLCFNRFSRLKFSRLICKILLYMSVWLAHPAVSAYN